MEPLYAELHSKPGKEVGGFEQSSANVREIEGDSVGEGLSIDLEPDACAALERQLRLLFTGRRRFPDRL
jgi:hypothetical protein